MLFFACLAPAISFGGLYEKSTGGQMGVVEVVVGSGAVMIAYAFLGGSPLVILGGTGPVFYFTRVLYDLCVTIFQTDDPPFLTVRFWTSIWVMVFCIIISVTDGSALMKFCTRFTDETFAALIALIFIWEALSDVFFGLDHAQECENLTDALSSSESLSISTKSGVGEMPVHYNNGTVDCCDTSCSLLSLNLTLGTFIVALALRDVRRSHYLPPFVRTFVADFGTVMSIMLLSGLRHLPWFEPTFVEALEVATVSEKNWLVNVTDPRMETWHYAATSVPALLATILIYLDQNITARVINAKDNRLKKGTAYHYDMLVVGLLIGVCGLFGFPWLIAATVRSLAHLHSLSEVEESVVNGHVQKHILSVRETRWTGLAIGILLAVSVFLREALMLVPMPVLYGVFLYMGYTSLITNQFYDRLKLIFTDPALYPANHYVRNVKRKVIHLYTLLQVACLVGLWLVKTNDTINISFPIFIMLLVPIRGLMGRYLFAKMDLAYLDSEETPGDGEEGAA
mmetsp:Transcript_18786/g.47626  ORF Transcript_18786/g.47626 Transcript_18786/m.47626 type:complete len:511 (-) Transcript_18786:3199-4731(-)